MDLAAGVILMFAGVVAPDGWALMPCPPMPPFDTMVKGFDPMLPSMPRMLPLLEFEPRPEAVRCIIRLPDPRSAPK